MDVLAKSRETIESALRGSNPCVLFSGGMDSLLTLHLVRQQSDAPVITFSADWTKEQMGKLERLAAEWNLTLYIYPPANRYFVPNGEGLSLVDEYGLGAMPMPVIRDFEDSPDGCALMLDAQRHEGFSLGWDVVFTGVLGSDRHYAWGQTALAKNEISMHGAIKFVSPLHDWTKEEVERQVADFGLLDLVIENTGDLKVCSKCLTGEGRVYCPQDKEEIDAIGWDKWAMLSAFRNKYGFEV